MKKLLFITVLVFITYNQNAKAVDYYSIQDSTKKKSTSTPTIPKSKLGIDMMILMSGEEKEVEIRKFSLKFIYFSSPGETSMRQIDRRLVNIIYYRSGRKEVITPKAVDIPKNSEWEKVKITENPKDVNPALMVEIDVIEVVVEASTDDQYYKPQTLENSAYIILKKKAALLNGEIVLIKKKSHNRPYGEAPSINIQAIAYRKITND